MGFAFKQIKFIWTSKHLEVEISNYPFIISSLISMLGASYAHYSKR